MTEATWAADTHVVSEIVDAAPIGATSARRKLPMIGIAVVAVLAIAGGVVLWLALKGDDDEATGGKAGTGTSAPVATATLPSTTRATTTTTVASTTTTVATTTSATTTTSRPPTVTAQPTTSAPTITVLPPGMTLVTIAPTTTAPPNPLANTCTSALNGWTISYPTSWYTVDASEPNWACSAFAAHPIVIPESSEIDATVFIWFSDSPLDATYADLMASDANESLTEAQLPIDGREAYRLEFRTTDASYYGAGVLLMDYLVDRGDGTTVVIEGVGYDEVDYRDNVKPVVDAMAATLML